MIACATAAGVLPNEDRTSAGCAQRKKSQVASLSRELKATTRKKSGITKLLKKYGASDVLTALASANQ